MSAHPIVEVAFDCADAPSQAAFWSAALGYDVLHVEPGVAHLHDPRGVNPFICFIEVPEHKTVKNRLHLDLVVTADVPDDERWSVIRAEAERLVELGATIRSDHEPNWLGMSDPEGNEFDVT